MQNIASASTRDDDALIRLRQHAIGLRVGNQEIGALGRHVGTASNPVELFNGSEQPPRPPAITASRIRNGTVSASVGLISRAVR